MSPSNREVRPPRGPGKLGNNELALAFELYHGGVKLLYIAEGLGCTAHGLSVAMNKARQRGMYDRRKARKVRHIKAVNTAAELMLRGIG